MTFDIYGSPKFWILWLAVLLICVQQGVKAIRTPTGILGFVPVICAMFGYLFVLQSMAVATTFGNLIGADFLEMGEFIALLSLIAILAGWYRGKGRVVLAPVQPIEPARGEMLWYCAISALFVGIVGEYVSLTFFMREFASTSAYLILLFHVAYPGLAICIYLVSYSQTYRSASNVLVLVILGSVFCFRGSITSVAGPRLRSSLSSSMPTTWPAPDALTARLFWVDWRFRVRSCFFTSPFEITVRKRPLGPLSDFKI